MTRDIGDTNEMKMTGLILSQSALVGLAVGTYSSGLWLPAGTDGDTWVNGMTYAMGALAIQTIAYYLFKMFFEQGMKEKVQVTEMNRVRQNQFRQQQIGFDQRRMDLELRVQEMQLENELRLLHEDPSRISTFNDGNISLGIPGDYHSTAQPIQPIHSAQNDTPLNLGLTAAQAAVDAMHPPAPLPSPPVPVGLMPLKKDGTPDLRYKRGSQ